MEKGVTHLYQYLKTSSNKDIHKNHYKLRMMVYTPCASHIYNISYMILEKGVFYIHLANYVVKVL